MRANDCVHFLYMGVCTFFGALPVALNSLHVSGNSRNRTSTLRCVCVFQIVRLCVFALEISRAIARIGRARPDIMVTRNSVTHSVRVFLILIRIPTGVVCSCPAAMLVPLQAVRNALNGCCMKCGSPVSFNACCCCCCSL